MVPAGKMFEDWSPWPVKVHLVPDDVRHYYMILPDEVLKGLRYVPGTGQARDTVKTTVVELPLYQYLVGIDFLFRRYGWHEATRTVITTRGFQVESKRYILSKAKESDSIQELYYPLDGDR